MPKKNTIHSLKKIKNVIQEESNKLTEENFCNNIKNMHKCCNWVIIDQCDSI